MAVIAIVGLVTQSHFLQNRNYVILHLMQPLLRIEEAEEETFQPGAVKRSKLFCYRFVAANHMWCGYSECDCHE